MELTTSAFNVLLEMTTIYDEEDRQSSIPSPDTKKTKNQSLHRVAEPILHYSNGRTSKIVSSEELIKIICSAPQAKHLVWTKGYKAWRVWKDIKSLKKAVKANLQIAQKFAKKQTIKTKRSKPCSMPARQSVPKQSKVKHSFNYLSVPATVFTQFDVDLSSIESATPFVGLGQSIQTGGLFLPTERVLNIGDYIQITVRVHGKPLLEFEAPILWLRTKQEGNNLKHGIAVAWPKLTSKQLRLIQTVTSTEHYEFFVA